MEPKNEKIVNRVWCEMERFNFQAIWLLCCSFSQNHFILFLLTLSVLCHPADPSSVSTVSLGQRLPFPAFPLRSSLPPLAPTVQAAAPPAEYHSDSAESLEEIPVVLAKLGSSSSAAVGDASTSSHRVIPAFPPPSPQPRTKRKASSSRTNKSTVELRFEMACTHPLTVFVSRASREAPDGDLSLGRRLTSSTPGSRPASRASLGSGVASWKEV